MNWSQDEAAAHGKRYLEDQRAERDSQERDRLAVARGLHDALAEMTPDARLMTHPVEAKPVKVRKPRAHPERDLEKACSDLLQFDGWRLLRTDPVSDRSRGKGFGEIGMADCLYIRYWSGQWNGQVRRAEGRADLLVDAEVVWIEWKGPAGKASAHQRIWIAAERARGALVWLCGADFPASVDGFLEHYRASGLMRRKL